MQRGASPVIVIAQQATISPPEEESFESWKTASRRHPVSDPAPDSVGPLGAYQRGGLYYYGLRSLAGLTPAGWDPTWPIIAGLGPARRPMGKCISTSGLARFMNGCIYRWLLHNFIHMNCLLDNLDNTL